MHAGMTYESIVATSSKSKVWLSRVSPSFSVLLSGSVVSAGDAVTSIAVGYLAYSCSLCRYLLVAQEERRRMVEDRWMGYPVVEEGMGKEK